MLFEKFKKYLSALQNAKKYDNIVFLGYNCEIAYRFYRQYKFIDSSLFAWSFVSFNQLKTALCNFETLGKGNFEYDYASHMFKDLKSGIYFHGKTPADFFTENENENNKIIENDKQELKSRLNYLKEKFIQYSQNGKKTLYIIKLTSNETKNDILWLYDYLKNFCKNDFTLLLITEITFFEQFLFDKNNILTRNVAKYSPDSCVTSKKEGDAFGWRLIFTEFQPKNRKKQKSKLKFEIQ